MGSGRPGRRRTNLKRSSPKRADAARDDGLLARRGLRLLLVCYLLIGGIYVGSIPLGMGPDETGHLRYVEHLARQRAFPVFDRTNPDPNYESHQPPLYYLLCLPSYLVGEARGAGGQAVRLFSLLISATLLYLTFALGRALVPDRPWPALAGAGVVAFLPMHTYISASASNDVLAEVWFAAALIVIVLYLRAAARYRNGETERPPGARAMLLVGALIGMGTLTKSMSVLLLPVAWAAAGAAARDRRGYRWGSLARDLLASTGLMLAVAGWWLLRNQIIYGGPLAQAAFLEAFRSGPGRRVLPVDWMQGPIANLSPPEYVLLVAVWTSASVLGVFGPVVRNQFAFYPWWLYLGAALVALAGMIGFLRFLRRSRPADWQRQAWWLAAFLGLLLVASFVSFNLSFFQAQARYMFPGLLPVAALALCLGVDELFPPAWRRLALGLLVGGLALFSLAGLQLWILPQLVLP